jgi:hypothetical protein
METDQRTVHVCNKYLPDPGRLEALLAVSWLQGELPKRALSTVDHYNRGLSAFWLNFEFRV